MTTAGSIGPFPVRLPMIDIRTVGTGGGSIAWIGAEGQLRVGPKSAGAEPGPMCYPNGGDAPTITDANAVLGRIPAQLIGGAIALDVDRARAGIEDLSGRLGGGMGPERLAAGIIEIANWNHGLLTNRLNSAVTPLMNANFLVERIKRKSWPHRASWLLHQRLLALFSGSSVMLCETSRNLT